MPAASAVTDRLTVSLIPKAAADLASLQARTGLGKTDVVNRAVSLYEFVDAQLAAGHELLVRHEDGTVAMVKLL
jgi:hypothetical protein